MLDDRAGGKLELAEQEPRGGQVVQVVERERLPVQLLDPREELRARSPLPVIRRPLMRVLSVLEVEDLVERDGQRVREGLALREPARDRRLVGRGRSERPHGERAPRVERDLAGIADLLQHEVVVLGPADRRAVGKVLRRSAQQRRAADVDELDCLLLGHAVTRHRGLERVEVHAHEVERLDGLLLERAYVLLDVQPGQDARVHPRVERLHAAAKHLRERREALDADHLQADVLEQAGGAAARHDLDVERGQPASECRKPGLVVGRDQRSHGHTLPSK